MTVGPSASVCTTTLSCTLVRGPIRIEAISPRSVALYQTEAPDSTVTSPIRHAVGAIHVSGAHLTIFPKLIDLMKEERVFGEMLLVAGGVIPEDDVARLRRLGVDAVIDQEASADELVGTVRALVEARRAAGADR